MSQLLEMSSTDGIPRTYRGTGCRCPVRSIGCVLWLLCTRSTAKHNAADFKRIHKRVWVPS